MGKCVCVCVHKIKCQQNHQVKRSPLHPPLPNFALPPPVASSFWGKLSEPPQFGVVSFSFLNTLKFATKRLCVCAATVCVLSVCVCTV